jgi:single-strand DNA-binding protein
MLGLNNIQIIGNLGNEPEVRQLNGNNGHVVNFSVAVNERWKNREGEPQERTTWLRI